MSIKKYSDYIALHEQKTRTIGLRQIVEIDENKELTSLWQKHAKHQLAALKAEDKNSNNPKHFDAADAVANHVRDKFGERVHTDMRTHSDEYAAARYYVKYSSDPKKYKDEHEAEMKRLRDKHGISDF